MTFQKELHEIVLINYSHLSDIIYVAKELKNTLTRLMRDMLTPGKLKEDWGIKPLQTTFSTNETDIIDNVKEFLGPERKTFVDHKLTLAQNLSKLYGLIWGQCTPNLKEDIIGLSEYKAKFSKYDCIWLLQHLNASS